MTYSEYIGINKNFKSSINLSYDLGNEDKIKNYILTASLVKCIKTYVNNIIDNRNNSTYINGPYGKGKSYLFLVLIYIFSKKKSKSVFENFKNKISVFDDELAKTIDNIEKNRTYFLPVLVNANTDLSIHDSFITALNTSLERSGIDEDLDIPTSYTLALGYIKKWEDSKDNLDIFKKCLENTSYSLTQLKSGLGKNSSKHLREFKNLFYCVTHGVEFKVWYEEDFSNIYLEVSEKIKNKFKGILVIFDEFGTFLETPNELLKRELKQIEKFAEMCNGDNNKTDDIDSEDYKLKEKKDIHFVLIAHKDFEAYNENENLKTTFKTIAGRFQKYDFSRSFEEDFTALLSSIEVKNINVYKKFSKYYEKIIDDINIHGIFTNEERKILIKKAFPFNPITLKVLVSVSRRLAQNERTMFSFMGSNASFTFYDFITHHSNELINIDYIYNYFEDSLSNSREFSEFYLRLKSAFNTCKTENEQKVIKGIGLLKIADLPNTFSINKENLALSLLRLERSDNPEIFNAINNLLERGVLKESVINKELDFLPLLSNSLNEKLAKYSHLISKIDEILKFITEINSKKFYISNEYNYKYKMTRFYEVKFMRMSLLRMLDEYASLLDEVDADGILINVYNDEEDNSFYEYIDELNKKLNALPIVLNPIKEKFSDNFIIKVQMLYKISHFLSSDIKLTDNEKNLLKTYEKALKNEVSSYVKNFVSVTDIELCKRLETYYPCTVVFNNEQVNRNLVTKTTLSALSTVGDAIINCNEAKYKNTNKTTSQEYTIYKSYENAIKTNNAEKLIIELVDLFKRKRASNFKIKEIVDVFSHAPYGMRNGIAPLFIESAISRITNNENSPTILLYNGKKEITYDTQNLIKTVYKPHDYSLRFISASQDKVKCLDELLVIFSNENGEKLSFKEKLNKVLESIKKYIYSLPQVCIHTLKNDNVLNLSTEAISFKEMFFKSDLNTYDTIFVELLKIFDTDILTLPTLVKKVKDEYVQKYNKLFSDETSFVIKSFGVKTGSIKASFDLFLSRHRNAESVIYENNSHHVFTALKNGSFSNENCLNLISSELLGTTLDDWNVSRKNKFERGIEEFVNTVRESKLGEQTEQSIKKPLSFLGKTFYNNIKSDVDEYASSLSNEEKITALEMVLKEIRGL